MTPERIAEIRAIIDGTSGVFSNASPRTIKAIIPIFATQSLPQALDTIEAQQRRIEELEAALLRRNETTHKAFHDGLSKGHKRQNEVCAFTVETGKINIDPECDCGNFDLKSVRSEIAANIRALQPREPS